MGKGRKTRAASSTMSNKLLLGTGGLLLMAIIIAAVSPPPPVVINYHTLATWEYSGDEQINTTYIPLTIDPTLLPGWPSVQFNSTSYEYDVYPPVDLEFTIIYNLTVRQDRGLLIDHNLAQKVYVNGNPIYQYFMGNTTSEPSMFVAPDIDDPVSGNYVIKYDFVMTYDMLQSVQWGQPNMEFIVGWLRCVDTSFKMLDFTLEIGFES